MTQMRTRTVVDELIDVGGCHLHFSVIKGSEITLVMEVGGGADVSEYGTFLMDLAQGIGTTVVSYDRAGFGKSELPATPYNLIQEIDWFMNGLRQLVLDKNVILMGHSYGGWLIRLIASRYPEVVHGMVFIDPFTTEFVDLLGVDYLDRHPFCTKDLPFAEAKMEDLTMNQRGSIRVVREGLGPKVEIMRQTVIPKNIPARIITSGKPWWKTSEEDFAWRKSHELMAASIPGAKLIIAEESDHLIPEKQPEIIIGVVRELIRLAKRSNSSDDFIL